ncbi:cache domain-containing protein, partial [Paenibacillus sepulcri]|nr:cache domain-containing protein [Paenibacillus sepulcri]
MGLFALYRSRNYFKRIFFTTILLIVPLLLIFCSVLYAFSRNTALELQQDANHKVLSQINYNIDNLNEMVTNLTVSTFNDRDIISLLNSPSLDMFQFYNKLEKMDRILISNPYLSSIAIYNSSNKCYYSTTFLSPISCGAKEPYNILKAFLEKNRTFPKLTLQPMTEEDGAGKGSVLSLLIYSSAGDYSSSQSILMLNVKSSWMFDNIRMINELGDNSSGYAFIIDSQGNQFSPREQAAPDDSIMQELNGRLLDVEAPSGYFIAKTAQGKQIVNYLTSRVNGWKIVSVQPYDAVFGKINAIGTFSLVVLLLFVAISLFVAAFASIKLYKPVGKLMNQLNLPPTLDR